MKFNTIFVVLLHSLFSTLSGFANTGSVPYSEHHSQIDSLIVTIFNDTINTTEVTDTIIKTAKSRNGSTKSHNRQGTKKYEHEVIYEPIDIQKILENYEKNKHVSFKPLINQKFLKSNPYFIDLKFYGYSSRKPEFTVWKLNDYFIEQQKSLLIPAYYKPISFYSAEYNLQSLRDITLRSTLTYQPKSVTYMVDELPDVTDLIQFNIVSKSIDKTFIPMSPIADLLSDRIAVKSLKLSRWITNSRVNLQFSQNYFSSNWYQGGSDNIATLGIINGTFNYDNKKNVQWDNFAEWRLGFNSVDGDTLRTLNTNDDILRATSKIGIKAGGNWFYSSAVDFSTHFFNNYKAVNSNQMKITLLTPVRFNVNVGLDYKYKKLFSLMLSPLSYKFIYASDTINVDKKSFGILPGDRVLSQIGSSLKAQLTYSPSREIQIDSKLSFYTNYEKVEIDWEIVTQFRVNRFLSTRLMLNPRYDNTVILAKGEKARIQFKELLTFGLSYRLL